MRTKKAVLNMVFGLIYQVIAIICGLITPRLILATFGSTYNGVISSATQFLNMINILTLGITGTTRVALYKTLADGDSLGTSRIMKATKRYMQKIGCCVILYAIGLCVIYPYVSRNSLLHIENAALIAIVSIGTFAQYFFGISNMTLLNADQSSYVNNIIDIFKVVLNTVCVAVLIKAGASVFIVKLGSSIVFLISPIVLNWYVKRKYNLVSNCEPDNAALNNRGAVALHQVANIVHDNTDIMVLTFFMDAKQISVYTVYYLVIGKIKTLLQVFTSGMEAAFGNMWVKHEIDTLNKVFKAYEHLLFSFTVVVFSCVGTLILPFVSEYTRGITDVVYYRVDFAVLITIAEATFCIRQPYLLLVYATGNYEATKRGALEEAIINLSLSIILVQFVGINGVIIGTLVANVFRTVQYSIFVSNKILNRSTVMIVKHVVWMLACMGVIVPIVMCLDEFVLASGWIGWLIKAVITFIAALTITVIFSMLFYRDDSMYLINKAKRVLHH